MTLFADISEKAERKAQTGEVRRRQRVEDQRRSFTDGQVRAFRTMWDSIPIIKPYRTIAYCIWEIRQLEKGREW